MWNGTAYLALADAQQMIGLGNSFSTVWLKVDSVEAQTIRQKLYQLPGVQSVQLKDEIVEDRNKMLCAP